ncbi:MAG: hypothetical protein PHY48_07065 [Candidatus Cloacimonetes bacterium]|nr:hypothetical protein [Candidatus Cloacimonadota bacterium]
MKKLTFIVVLLAVLFLSSCSEKDNPTDVPPIDTNVYGYQLDQFISQSAVHDLITTDATDLNDYRSLFGYEIVGSDGVSPRDKIDTAGYDLPWSKFKEGFFVPSKDMRTWFPPALTLPGAFKIKNAETFRLYRKVNVIANNDTTMVELKGLTIHSIPNWNDVNEDAIKLSDLLQGITTYESATLNDIGGYNKTFTPEQIADGYYLLASETTTFPNFNPPTGGGQWKFKRLASINVTTTETQNHAFGNAAHGTENISFTMPSDLSTFTKVAIPY